MRVSSAQVVSLLREYKGTLCYHDTSNVYALSAMIGSEAVYVADSNYDVAAAKFYARCSKIIYNTDYAYNYKIGEQIYHDAYNGIWKLECANETSGIAVVSCVDVGGDRKIFQLLEGDGVYGWKPADEKKS